MPKPTPAPGRGSRSLRRAGFALAGLLTLALGLASGGAVAYMKYIEGGFEPVAIPEGVLTKSGRDAPESELARGVTNIILVGSDSREALSEEEQEKVGDAEAVGGQRSDTLILLHFDPAKQKAVLVHFPRDLRVEIPGVGTDKINAAYNTGGHTLAIKTVKGLSGLDIHHYVEINFEGFRGLVESVGGVEICIDKPMVDRVANLRLPKAGCYTLGGRKALAFVRARNVEGDVIPDFARIARQQQFIRALLQKVLTVGSLLRPTAMREAAGNVKADPGFLSLTNMYFIANQLKDIGGEKGNEAVDFRVVPAIPQTIDGISYVVPLEPDATEFFDRLKRGEPLGQLGAKPAGTLPSPATVEVVVLDAGNAKRAAKAEAKLEKGFAYLGIRPAPEGYGGGVILHRPGREGEAEVVQGFFPKFEIEEAPKAVLGDAEVAVVVGPRAQENEPA